MYIQRDNYHIIHVVTSHTDSVRKFSGLQTLELRSLIHYHIVHSHLHGAQQVVLKKIRLQYPSLDGHYMGHRQYFAAQPHVAAQPHISAQPHVAVWPRVAVRTHVAARHHVSDQPHVQDAEAGDYECSDDSS
jgi:hypothetical protein